MTGILAEIGQGDFAVRINRFSPTDRVIVARTLSGHPLAGWRYWGVKELPGGDVLIETFSVEHPATFIDETKLLYLGGLTAMYQTWTAMLNDIAGFSGGQIVKGPETELDGRQEMNIGPFLGRV